MKKSSHVLLNSQWVKEEITKEIRKYFELNKSEDKIYQNLLDAVKAVTKEKFIALNTYIKMISRSTT